MPANRRNKSSRKHNDSPYAKKEANNSSSDSSSAAEPPEPDFKFLGFPGQEFQYKSNSRSEGAGRGGKGSIGSAHGSKAQAMKGVIEPDDEDIHIPLLFPFLPKHQSNANEGSEDYCTEIVDQMRQNNNSLIDEVKESRKAIIESNESANKQLIEAIKQLQKTLVEDLPKVLKK